ncbi:hypothetical protein HAZT_HAZT007527 [Hyalella azteca]|uniref:Uncharacterized protein n=1 Tax=Hyalella azteca TaxID=294128 RepID=A0A6A0H8Y4_HYAAZ|nr:hypothetical protein HAZT_HAZT007527 [Hyalella azteca]
MDCWVRLRKFSGSVGTSAGVTALASVCQGADLTFHMLAPLDFSALGGTYKNLSVYTRPLPPPASVSPTLPLPPSPPPWLHVQGADEGSWEAVAHTITSLAPPGKRFRGLTLQFCRLRAAELPLLLQYLHAAGVRTVDGTWTVDAIDTCAWAWWYVDSGH